MKINDMKVFSQSRIIHEKYILLFKFKRRMCRRRRYRHHHRRRLRFCKIVSKQCKRNNSKWNEVEWSE